MTDLSYCDRVDWPFLGYSLKEDGGMVGAHRHEKSQLFFAISGEAVLDFDTNSFVLPPMSAAWIPGGTLHGSHYCGPAKVGMLYMDRRLAPPISSVGKPILMKPLLRELLARVFSEDVVLTPDEPRHVRLFSVLLDELAASESARSGLQIPRDSRLQRLLAALMKDPSNIMMTAEAWGTRFGMSERTLSRLFRSELGMSFAQAREQIQIEHAVRQLEAGHSVNNVAFALGYKSPSAFIAMFKRNTGKTPGMLSARTKLTTMTKPSCLAS
jgi:AraC-like DNA-binding protein